MEGKRVLIVDDEGLILNKMAQAVRSLGVEVDTETDGALAWKRLKSSLYHLVVTDLSMPEMDGHQLMEKVAVLPKPPTVIVVTGYPSMEAAINCMKNGAKDFLQKPFSSEELVAAIGRQLEANSASGAPEENWGDFSKAFDLTPAQLRVAQAIYNTGHPTDKLADDLCLSPHTVRSHLQAIYQKTGIRSRIALIKKISQHSFGG